MNDTITKHAWHLTAAMPHPRSVELGSSGLCIRKLFAALLLIGTTAVPATAHAQFLRAAERAAARAAVRSSKSEAAMRSAEHRAAMRSAERRAAKRAVTRREVWKSPCTAISQKCAGLKREAAAQRILSDRYPNERIQAETYLRNRNGKKAVDPKTGKGRRVDFILFSRDGHTRRYEVTSQKADKRAQLAKEQRILERRRNGTRRTGPVYVRNRKTGKLVPVKPETSKVIRFH